VDDLASILERSEADQRASITDSCLTFFYVHRSSVLLEHKGWMAETWTRSRNSY